MVIFFKSESTVQHSAKLAYPLTHVNQPHQAVEKLSDGKINIIASPLCKTCTVQWCRRVFLRITNKHVLILAPNHVRSTFRKCPHLTFLNCTCGSDRK